MGAPMLSLVFGELLRHLGGSAGEVFLREYAETAPADPEAGMPALRAHTDTLIEPTPIVLDTENAQGEGLMETFAGRRGDAGYRKVIVHGSCAARLGSILYFAGAEWEVTCVRAPVLYGETPLKLLLARRIQP
jgi:hypothetical protein